MTDATVPTDPVGTEQVPPLDPTQVLAQRVRALREATGESQRSLAGRIAYSHTIVNRVENAHWPVSWHSVEAIVTALGVTKNGLAEWKMLWQTAQLSYSDSEPVVQLLRPFRSMVDGIQFELLELASLRAVTPAAPTEVETGPVRPRGYREQLYLPNPKDVRTVSRYVDALRRLRASVGNPSYRKIAARTPGLPHTTLHDLFKPGRVELDVGVVHMFLRGCGLTTEEIGYWNKLFQHLSYRPRNKFVRQIDQHSPPPTVDLAGVTTAPQFVAKLRDLARAADRSIDTVVRRAKMHRGSYLPCRSALFARFRNAVKDEALPERDVVVSFLRGCYCRTHGSECVPDCKADLIEPWMRVYDRIHRRSHMRPVEGLFSTAPDPALDTG